MSKNNSKKEFLFAIFLKKNKEIIEKEVEIKIKDIHLEKWFENRRVDINCVCETGERLLIEFQMDCTSYSEHIRQIQDLIVLSKKNEKTIIVYGMLEFKEELITELMQNIVFYSEKSLELIFLEINKDVLEQLISINKLDEIGRLKELNRLSLVDKIFTAKKGIKTYNNLIITNGTKDNDTKYTYQEELLISIAKRLREDCSKISTNVYQYKIVKNNSFLIGSGLEDIAFKISLDRKGKVGVELCFSRNKKEIFFKLLEKRDILQNEFNFILKFDERFRKIATHYPISWFHSDRELMIKRFCRDVKSYLSGFNIHLKQAVEEYRNKI
ncbi:hypothetical protein OSC52_13585 [Clostridium pasteurianum]|uniref:hypothetical protein n=1 Tax=Clostridium pasteurianum TaxID=1501 RepID=UPI0022608FD5|nr:hypothetical protein [Clostridium pasteurianum]UZW12881.1 hypothetical protein OSC52_13585 [Clostridium pasteurianum]